MSTSNTLRSEDSVLSKLRRVISAAGSQNVSLMIAILLVASLVGSQNPNFLSARNVLNIGSNSSIVGLIALGQTLVIIAGMLDISVGSIAGVASVCAALAVNGVSGSGAAVVVGILAAIGVGLVLGSINGLIVTKLRVNAVIATLATLSAFKGLAFLVAPDGKPVSVFNETMTTIGIGRLYLAGDWAIPYTLTLLVAVAVMVHILLRYSRFGRNTYALGGNETAARLAGIPTDKMKLSLYVLCGGIAGFAGFILAARTNSGQPVSGSQGLELEAITAVFLGGAALEGGKGSIPGTFLAVILIGMLSNGMNLLGVSTFYQFVAKGLLLVFAVGINQWREGRAARQRMEVVVA